MELARCQLLGDQIFSEPDLMGGAWPQEDQAPAPASVELRNKRGDGGGQSNDSITVIEMYTGCLSVVQVPLSSDPVNFGIPDSDSFLQLHQNIGWQSAPWTRASMLQS